MAANGSLCADIAVGRQRVDGTAHIDGHAVHFLGLLSPSESHQASEPSLGWIPGPFFAHGDDAGT